MKLLVHDGFGVWCAARRLNQGRFQWSAAGSLKPMVLSRQQFDALVLGLPCPPRLDQVQRITHV
jgi:hypothetical protein